MVFTCDSYCQVFLIDSYITWGLKKIFESGAVLRWDVISVHLLLFERFPFKFMLVLFLKRKWQFIFLFFFGVGMCAFLKCFPPSLSLASNKIEQGAPSMSMFLSVSVIQVSCMYPECLADTSPFCGKLAGCHLIDISLSDTSYFRAQAR